MTTTVLKTCFKKQNPKLIVCRKDKNYDNILFRKEFLSKLRDLLPNDKSMKGFQDTSFQTLNSLPSSKTKYVRANQAPFMNKKLQRAIMIRSELRNGFLRDRTDSNKKAYYKQRNICVKPKKQYYSNL